MSKANILDKLSEGKLPGGGRLFGWGTTVPTDTTPGYAKGAIFMQTDGAAGAIFHTNEGTKASSAFKAHMSEANSALLIGGGQTAGLHLHLRSELAQETKEYPVSLPDLRPELAQQTKEYPISLADLRAAAAVKDALADAPDATTLGLADAAGSVVTGTTTNGGATASASETAAFDFTLPAEYVDGQAITVRVRSKVSVTREAAQTVDVVAKLMGDAGLGSDICTTTVITLTTSYADHDFTITPTGLVAGDVLHVEITLATDDTGATADGFPTASKVSVRCEAAVNDALAIAPDGTMLGLADAAGSLVTGTTTNGGATVSASETTVFDFVLPAEYVSGEAITVRVRAKVSAAREVSQTVDVVAKLMGDAGLGSDICTTTVITLTEAYADHDFTITPTSLVAGDVLHIEITLATDDTGASADGYPTAAKVSVRCGVKG